MIFRTPITGTIPVWIGDLTNLEWLYLDRNKLMGPIPDVIENLTNLNLLGLGGNKIIGPTPVSIGGLTYLHVLFLNANQLTGPVPTSISQLPFRTCGINPQAVGSFTAQPGWDCNSECTKHVQGNTPVLPVLCP